MSPDAEPIYRLLTTILDPKEAPARELAALYHERWEIETALDELKTHLRGARIVLRSKTPDLVRQEFYGLLMAHFAVRCQGYRWKALPGTGILALSGLTLQVPSPIPLPPDNPSQCGTVTSMSITITTQITPTFTQIGPLCQNSIPPTLPGVSLEGITGDMEPVIDKYNGGRDIHLYLYS